MLFTVNPILSLHLMATLGAISLGSNERGQACKDLITRRLSLDQKPLILGVECTRMQYRKGTPSDS